MPGVFNLPTPPVSGFSNGPLHPFVKAAVVYFGIPWAMYLALVRWPRLAFDPSWFGRVFWLYAKALTLAERWPVAAAVLVIGNFLVLLVLISEVAKRGADRLVSDATGLTDELKAGEFKRCRFEPFPYLMPAAVGGFRPAGKTFVGMTPKSLLSWPLLSGWKPVYLSETERSMHRHVLGKTGSGKTTSVLWPQVFQDALDGKGALVMDAKGSDENARMMRAIARAAGRENDLRILALPAWNRPGIFSHAYNMVQVAPRFIAPPPRGERSARGLRAATASDPGGDVVAMAERVFSVFALGDNVYYATQGLLAFTRICRALHGIVGSSGHGYVFTLQDLGICLRGVAQPKSRYANALKFCLEHTLDADAGHELLAQVHALGNDAGACLSGLLAAVDRFQSPLVNAYAPDIVLEEALEQNLLVYAQLPSNLFKLQAPALAKVMLMDLQQEASLRQVFRTQRNQRAFAVTIDEFGSFADLSFIDSLNKLRDANIQFTLSHQSMADLELVSKEFAQAVLDNTRTRDVLALDDPKLCEQMAATLGTYARLENTIQRGNDPLVAYAPTGVMSSKAVEAFRLHPNRLKTLAPRGQGYLFFMGGEAERRWWWPFGAAPTYGNGARPVNYAPMPALPQDWSHELPRNAQKEARGLRLYERFVKA